MGEAVDLTGVPVEKRDLDLRLYSALQLFQAAEPRS